MDTARDGVLLFSVAALPKSTEPVIPPENAYNRWAAMHDARLDIRRYHRRNASYWPSAHSPGLPSATAGKCRARKAIVDTCLAGSCPFTSLDCCASLGRDTRLDPNAVRYFDAG